MKDLGKKSTILLLIFIFLPFSLASSVLALQAGPQGRNQAGKTPEESEKIVSSPQNIKESTAIYVFIGWLWASIFVLIYLLRQKIKETDRLYSMNFFSPAKK